MARSEGAGCESRPFFVVSNQAEPVGRSGFVDSGELCTLSTMTTTTEMTDGDRSPAGSARPAAWGARLLVGGILLLTQAAGLAGAPDQDPAASDAATASATHVRLGLALRELGRNDEAIEAFREALAVNAEDPVARLNLGALLADNGDAEGIEHLQRLVDAQPEDSWALYELAESLRRFDRWEEALVHYQRLVELDPGYENGRIGEAEALTAVGRFSESLAKVEAVQADFPGSRGAKFGLAWLLAASPEAELRDGERALALADELFTERRSLGALELVAAARAEAGRCEEAAQIQRSVVNESLHHDRPAETTARLAAAAEWYASEPCRVPPGRPADERPYWPRARPEGAGETAPPTHDH